MNKLSTFSMLLVFAATLLSLGQALADPQADKPGDKAQEKEAKPEGAPDGEPDAKAPDKSLKEGKKEEKTEKKWNTFLGSLFKVTFEGAGKAIYDVVLRDHGFRYRAFPYSLDKYAFYDPDTPPRGAPGVLRTEYQRMNSDFYGLTLRLTLRMGSGFDLSLSDTTYDERSRFDKQDRMKFTRLRISYLRSPASGNILMRSGTGVVSVGGRSGLDVGFELDCFPYKPFVFRAGFSQIFIANHSGITEYDFALGVITGAFELALGYRGIVMKRKDINGIYLSLGFWF